MTPERTLLLTRGNVDGLMSAAFLYAVKPEARTAFMAHSGRATDFLRQDLKHSHYVLSDLSLDEELTGALRIASKRGASITYLDHHQHSVDHLADLPNQTLAIGRQGISAAGLMYEHFQPGERFLPHVAIADHIEHCHSPTLAEQTELLTETVISQEARILDFAWRLNINDDQFRETAARRLATGAWPSQIQPIMDRYNQVVGRGRWERALENVRKRMTLRDGLAIMDANHSSLMGFGARAIVEVAKEIGALVAVRVLRNRACSNISLRRVQASHDLNLGSFVEDFTLLHGEAGGGHPQSAGARIKRNDTRLFLRELEMMV